MIKLTIDFESRSEVPLKQTGVYPYAESETTEIMCLACIVEVDGEITKQCIWVPEKFQSEYSIQGIEQYIITEEELQEWFRKAELIEAHNAEFERVMYENVLQRRKGTCNV